MTGIKRAVFLLFVPIFCTLIFCKREKLYLISENDEGKSIMDIEYINDTLDINIVDFRVINLSKNHFELKLYMFSENPDYQPEDYQFFIHAYPETKIEKPGNFLPWGTNKFAKRNDTLIYSRKFKSQITKFELIRYGLLDKEKGRRLFTLKLDSVNIMLGKDRLDCSAMSNETYIEAKNDSNLDLRYCGL